MGCAERKDDILRPRVLCDSGAPRNTLRTYDTGELVHSRNECAGPMRHQPGEANPKWHTEVKPRLEDAAVNLAVLGHLAALCDTTPLVFVFDFMYFFHQFVLAAHELAASGSLVPERAREAGAPDTLVAVATSVMAMGVAPASNVAQDLANALMWRLLACLDAASAPHVARLRRKYPEFDEAWRTRQQLAHDAYSSQARLASALDYMDDAMLGAMGPVISYLLLSEFARMIAPRHMWAGCALDRVLDERRLAASVADSLARASVGASIPRLHGLGLEAAGPQKLWGGHAAPWTGAVLSGAYGAMWITHAKLLRTHASAQRLLAGEMRT